MTTTDTTLIAAYVKALKVYAKAHAKLENCTLACADRASYTAKYYSTREDASWVLDKATAAAAFAAAKAGLDESQHDDNLCKARKASR